ncbi:MAG: hypothetical protein GEV03_03935 [Streptosporangiales bacterium]|nr:hypothetical protein [Streptosporangiales bacterium]
MGLKGGRGDDEDCLPPVDVVVPNDARELEADVRAYHRELRRRHRRQRWTRLARGLRLHGITLPLALVALLLVGLSTALMTLLGPRPTSRPSPAALANRPPAAPGKVGGLLPDTAVVVGEERERTRQLRPAVVALIPWGCRCDRAADELYRQARAFSLPVYFVASRRPVDELRPLIGTAGHGLAVPVHDGPGTLESAYHASGLTAVLVRRDLCCGGVESDKSTPQHRSRR